MWGDVGMTGEWATKPISLYGRNSISGTYEFFKQTVLYGGDFKESVKQQPGSEAVVENVANDKFAIGYSGLGYKTDGVRTVPLAAFYGKECYDTTSAATYSGMRFVTATLRVLSLAPVTPYRRSFLVFLWSFQNSSTARMSLTITRRLSRGALFCRQPLRLRLARE
jgi:phosphate transport system substrate-binding protein